MDRSQLDYVSPNAPHWPPMFLIFCDHEHGALQCRQEIGDVPLNVPFLCCENSTLPGYPARSHTVPNVILRSFGVLSCSASCDRLYYVHPSVHKTLPPPPPPPPLVRKRHRLPLQMDQSWRRNQLQPLPQPSTRQHPRSAIRLWSLGGRP